MQQLTRRHFFGLTSLLVACARRPSLAAPECSGPTAANIEGPFYKKGAPHRAVLASGDDPGERLVINGVVRSSSCEPIAGAEMEIWHADAKGAYDNDGFHFRGTLGTDAKGRWELHSIIPGRYLNGDRYRPAHVHVKLHAKNHKPLTTQLYFAGDPYNEGDPFIVDSLILAHAKRDGAQRAAFDFVLQRA